MSETAPVPDPNTPPPEPPALRPGALLLDLAALLYLLAYAWPVLDTSIRGQPAGRLCTTVVLVVWALFAVDYVVGLVRSEDRVAYVRHHVIDLLAVALPALKPLRLLQVLLMLHALNRRAGPRVRSRLAATVAASTVVILLLGSLAVLDAERDAPGSNIHSFGTALWWGVTTVTTVGYGDVYPVTVVGRVVATVMMLTGITLLGAITASIASWLVDRVRDAERLDTAGRHELHALTAEVARLRAELSLRPAPPGGPGDPD